MKRTRDRKSGKQSAPSSAKRPAARTTRPSATSGISDDRVTIAQLRAMMREFVRQRAWAKYHTPRNLAASVAVEAGELLELFQWLTPEEAQSRGAGDGAFRRAVADEISDVLMYLLSLANALDLDVAEAAMAKMARNRLKYPVDKFRGHYQRPLG